MSVVIEMLNVVVRRSSIEAKYPGGFAAFEANCPNFTLSADEHLARVGFMGPWDVESFLAELEQAGLTFLENDTAVDIVVLEHFEGPTTACAWIDWGSVPDGHLAAWLRGTAPGPIAIPKPPNWDPLE